MRILAISPHLDDAELGAGAAIARFVREGHSVHLLGFAAPYGTQKKVVSLQCMEASTFIGIPFDNIHLEVDNFATRHFDQARQLVLDKMIKYREIIKPDLVFTTSSHDFHQDHVVVHNETIRAFHKGPTILGYDFPWDYTRFDANYFIPVSEDDVTNKVLAVQRYKTEYNRCDAMDDKVIKSLAILRGSQTDSQYAEAFEFIRGTQ